MARALTQTEFLVELEPVVEENLHRHMGVAKEWFPHEYVPRDDACTFDGILGGTPPGGRRTPASPRSPAPRCWSTC